MARWKARVRVSIAIIELFSLALTVEALQGKTLLSGEGGHFEPRFQGKGSSLGNIFLVSTKLDTFSCLTLQTASSYVQSF